MRLPPWLLILMLGLLAALAWFLFDPLSADPRMIETATTSKPDEEPPAVVIVDPGETRDRIADLPSDGAESTEPTDADWLRFLVLDAETRQPIVAARISHSHGFSPREEEVFTNADGQCAFARANIASEHGWSFLLFAEGFQTKMLSLNGPLLPDEEILIEADRAGTLAGVVRKPDGSPAPGGTWVVAWTGSTPIPEEFAAMQLAYIEAESIGTASATFAEGSRLVTRTDARGEFRFTDLAATQEYRLLAASEGMLSRTLSSASPETSEPIELKLLYAWGIHLIARDAQGSPLPGDGRVSLDRGSASWSFPDGRWPILGGTDAALPLAGLPLAYSESIIGQPDTQRSALTGYTETEVAPSVAVSIQPPGFARHQAEYALIPLNSKFQSFELKFDRIATQFGSLELEIKNSPLNETNRGERNQSIVIARLYPLGFPESGRDEVLSFALVHPEVGLEEFSGIPAGEYWLGFESANRLLKIHWETQRLVIGNSPAQAQLDLGSVGALNLDVLTQEGSEFPERRAWVRFKSLTESPRVYGQIMLQPGKNQISLIPAGDYELALVRETERSHTLVPDVPIHFRITAGETSSAEILLAERN
jgi:hypothetical protein